MSLQVLKFEELEEGKIVRVTISRPKNLNAMNMPFFNEIRDTFKHINTLPNVRAVILQADGKHFTAGLDLKEMSAIFAPSDTEGTPHTKIDQSRFAIELYNKVKELQEPFMCIYECRVPVIVGVHGLCIGGGIDLICTADIRFCSKDAYSFLHAGSSA
jgi:enoyl-CoA hydratase/carnithine racemase